MNSPIPWLRIPLIYVSSALLFVMLIKSRHAYDAHNGIIFKNSFLLNCTFLDCVYIKILC